MRRVFLISLGLIAGLVPALAQNRPDSRAYSCAEVQDLIIQYGAVVLTTGRNTYDRYVVDGRFCASPDVARLEGITTADTNQCPVYRCGPSLFDDDDDFWD